MTDFDLQVPERTSRSYRTQVTLGHFYAKDTESKGLDCIHNFFPPKISTLLWKIIQNTSPF